MNMHKLFDGVRVLETNVDFNKDIKGVEYDSRKISKDYLFVAIKGTGTDGHLFINNAFNAGASCVLIENPEFKQGNFILVEDSRKALSIIASNLYGNPAKKLKLIGVTGTNGKTTTTFLIKQMLENLGHKAGLIGTIQNMIGDRVIETKYTTPEPLELQRLFSEMVKENIEYAVMEVSSHSLAQERVSGLDFKVGVFTNLTQDHLDFHKTMENYLYAKSKLFKMSEIGVINGDDEASKKLLELSTARNICYSADKDCCDVIAKNIKYQPDGVDYEVIAEGKIGHAHVSIPGKFSVYNSLAAISTLLVLGFDLKKILESLKMVKGVKGRLEVVNTGRDFTVIIDYAHTPDALLNVLTALRGVTNGRIVTLFGCGGDRDRTKRPIMGKIAFDLSDYCIVTSDNPRSEEPMNIINDILEGVKGSKTPYKVIENRKEAIEYALKNAKSNDTILLAGKGHETYQILKDKTISFDEREIIREILNLTD